MIPKKKRRVIDVNGSEYEYVVYGSYDLIDEINYVHIYVKNIKSGRYITKSKNSSSKISIKLSDIREIISEEKL